MDTNLLTLDKLFSKDVHYSIPDFQRRYVWKKEDQWAPLWEDVSSAAEERLASDRGQAVEHFMGAMVLQELDRQVTEPPRYDVIDGQQRMTTLQLLLRAVQSVLKEQQPGLDAFVNPMVVNNEMFVATHPRFRLKMEPKPQDRSSFGRAMADDGWQQPGGSQILLAYEYFREEVAKWLGDSRAGSIGERSNALLGVLKTQLIFVVIETGSLDDSHLVFETLNARGTPLSAWDMVRNSMTGQLPNDSGIDLGAFDDDWWQDETGRGRARRTRIDNLLIAWLTMRSKRVCDSGTARKIFEDYRKYISESEGALEPIVRDLIRVSSHFRKMQELDDGSALGTFLQRWRVLPQGAFDPVVLWLLTELDQQGEDLEEQQTTALKMIESYFVRRLLTGASRQGGGSDLVALALQLLEELPAWDATAVGEEVRMFFVRLKKEKPRIACPNDKEFSESLISGFPVYKRLNQRQTGMILRAIEEHLRSDLAETSVPASLTIEHIMPQRWAAEDWPHPVVDITQDEEAKEERRTQVDLIGNLTLVTRKLNSKLSNAPWSEKRETMKEFTVLRLNAELTGEKYEDHWNESDIQARSKLLADRCAAIWPTPQNLA